MSDTQYKTFQVWIKKGHSLFSYFEQMCQYAKNVHNTTNFYIRQVYTAYRQETSLQPLQQKVLDTLQQYIVQMNEGQDKAYRLRMAREQQKPLDQRKDITCNQFALPSKENFYVDYHFLDSLFKAMKQADYRSLPTQSSQWVMKSVFQNWKSFFASIKDYRQYPEKYKGRPRIPTYCRAKEKEILFTNQDCVIKDHKYLKFPKTKQRLSIGKVGRVDGKLKQVRVIPKYGQYVVELIFDCPFEPADPKKVENQRYMAMDLGIDNLATIVTNTGKKPTLVKGGKIKAINQYYNKMKAHYTGVLRQGKSSKGGPHTSTRLEKLHKKRHLRIKDLFHKASYYIVHMAVKQNIGTIIIGQNQGWKNESNIGKRNNQSFCHIPHHLMISMIQYKATHQGINVQLTEEAYTSKASFLDHDPLPVYEERKIQTFSGKRIHRGLYKSPKGIINADVNGAANILRKVVPTVSAYGIEGLDGNQSVNVSTPLVLSIR
jgi:putative transposase